MLLVHNIKKLDLEVLLVLFLLSLGFFHKSILGLAVNLVPHLPSFLGPLCPAQARVLRLRPRVLIRKHCNYKNLGLNSTLSVQPEEEGTHRLLRLPWNFSLLFTIRPMALIHFQTGAKVISTPRSYFPCWKELWRENWEFHPGGLELSYLPRIHR